MVAGRVECIIRGIFHRKRYTTCADGTGVCGIDERTVGRALESKFLFLEGDLFLSLIAFRGSAVIGND